MFFTNIEIIPSYVIVLNKVVDDIPEKHVLIY